MKLLNLKIKDFRGLTFEHNFSNDRFIVLTGVNGSGKSTIIDVLKILLTQQANTINEPLAMQVTSEKAVLEVEVQAESGEVHYLAQKIHDSQPNQAPTDQIEQALCEKIFISGIYKRRIEIARPILGWKAGGQYVREFINDGKALGATYSAEDIISPSAFSVLSRELVLKFEQLETLNLSFSQDRYSDFSIQDIFQPGNDNPGQRISRTAVSASRLLDSLVGYTGKDDSQLLELIHEFNNILDPITISVSSPVNGISQLVLDRGDGHTYTVESASSGQKKAIVIAMLKHVWKRSTFKPIVLLDEPENSMHPGLTSRIFTSLNELADNNESSFIIATHSSDVVAANTKNTYRIVTSNGISNLKKVVGLEERALAINELGVHFHIDYVAQKIVFVESKEAAGSKGGLNDATAYQLLIDPNKESYLFVSCGSKVEARRSRTFQDNLLAKLKLSIPEFTLELTDRDDDEYDATRNTPFRNIEYLYISNTQLLAEALTSLGGVAVTVTDIEKFIPNDQELINVDAKKIWANICRNFSLKKKMMREIQTYILQRMRDKSTLQDETVKQLVKTFSNRGV